MPKSEEIRLNLSNAIIDTSISPKHNIEKIVNAYRTSAKLNLDMPNTIGQEVDSVQNTNFDYLVISEDSYALLDRNSALCINNFLGLSDSIKERILVTNELKTCTTPLRVYRLHGQVRFQQRVKPTELKIDTILVASRKVTSTDLCLPMDEVLLNVQANTFKILKGYICNGKMITKSGVDITGIMPIEQEYYDAQEITININVDNLVTETDDEPAILTATPTTNQDEIILKQSLLEVTE